MTDTIDAAGLPSFGEARPLGKGDETFIAELRDVLERHGNIDRFGLCLLHEHFPVDAGEILMETNDPKRRTLTATPELAESLPDFKATMWRLHPRGRDVPGGPDRTIQVLQGAPCQVLQGCEQDKCK